MLLFFYNNISPGGYLNCKSPISVSKFLRQSLSGSMLRSSLQAEYIVSSKQNYGKVIIEHFIISSCYAPIAISQHGVFELIYRYEKNRMQTVFYLVDEKISSLLALYFDGGRSSVPHGQGDFRTSI